MIGAMINKNDIRLPETPILVAGLTNAVWLSSDGEIDELSLNEAAKRMHQGAKPILCHAPVTAGRLKIDPFEAFDVLELFAFVSPGVFTIPTPRGLAAALGLPVPKSLAEEASGLRQVVLALLGRLGDLPAEKIMNVAWAMARGGWVWAPAVLAALGEEAEDKMRAPGSGLDVWNSLAEWSEHAPSAPPGNEPVAPAEARHRLTELLGHDSEERPSQADYASAASAAFQPRNHVGAPHLVLAEAGTGVGKTLGYLAPASLWAEKNEAPVWVSTFTRNLQHQIDQELDALYADENEKARRVVVRKGRENYLCLLNMEEAVRGVAIRKRDAIALGLLARWAAVSRDGSVTGGDFPAWLVDLVGRARTVGLTDRRGECIYSSCAHYAKCFIEKNIRRARRADLVVANHALVMVQAARGRFTGSGEPVRFVFDEGHHVFDAADSAFSAYLSGREAAELRRWMRGGEGGSRSRARGLKRRIEDLLGEDEPLNKYLDAALEAARALPGEGWHQRCGDGRPVGPTEAFLAAVRGQAYARSPDARTPYDLECDISEPVEGLLEAAAALEGALFKMERPLKSLRLGLEMRLEEEADTLDTQTRNRIEAVTRSIQQRGELCLSAWRSMLASLAAERPEEFVDWFSVARIDGRDIDVGMHRHWIDPTIPFAAQVQAPAHGVLVTSATLRDGTGDAEADWQAAEARTGARHLPDQVIRAEVPSPFDYSALTRVFIVTDVRKDDLNQVAAAYRELFLAAGGGALGLFTAISRLRAVQSRITQPLDGAGLPLYAQHVDRTNLSTLIDIFRAEEDSCLLGTDAVRDGVDVPGRSLRLIVFDRVPWPRPTILHRARRAAFGKKVYDDMITRLRMKQAYGRLVRRADDQGVFVMLDPMTPSRLLGAFPEGVEVVRVGLAEAVLEVRGFLATLESAQAIA
jgi:ATP-dependent DNA helicase DinG